MPRKFGRIATAPSKKRAVVDDREILSAIEQGRLTRRQFDAWHLQRRIAGKGFVITMRDNPSPPPKISARKHKGRRASALGKQLDDL